MRERATVLARNMLAHQRLWTRPGRLAAISRCTGSFACWVFSFSLQTSGCVSTLSSRPSFLVPGSILTEVGYTSDWCREETCVLGFKPVQQDQKTLSDRFGPISLRPARRPRGLGNYTLLASVYPQVIITGVAGMSGPRRGPGDPTSGTLHCTQHSSRSVLPASML
jgi:hypothetical protein